MFSSDSSDEDYLMAAMLMGESRGKKRKYWIHPTLQKRTKLGEFSQLIQELENDEQRFYDYFRMTKDAFEELHILLKEDLDRSDTNYRKSITARERLAITLR